MDASRGLAYRKQPQRQMTLLSHIFASNGSMAMEHAGQSAWEQGAVGILCAVGGGLLAYWSMQGFVGLAVIALCVTFSTLVTAALSHYYDRAIDSMDGCQRPTGPRAPTPRFGDC